MTLESLGLKDIGYYTPEVDEIKSDFDPYADHEG